MIRIRKAVMGTTAGVQGRRFEGRGKSKAKGGEGEVCILEDDRLAIAVTGNVGI